MKGVGVDIVDLRRLDLNKTSFITKVLTSNELRIFESINSEKRKREFLGGRFAGKEAFMKANHQGIGGLFSFSDIEILNHEDGSPYLNHEKTHISISHEEHYAIAFVVVE